MTIRERTQELYAALEKARTVIAKVADPQRFAPDDLVSEVLEGDVKLAMDEVKSRAESLGAALDACWERSINRQDGYGSVD